MDCRVVDQVERTYVPPYFYEFSPYSDEVPRKETAPCEFPVDVTRHVLAVGCGFVNNVLPVDDLKRDLVRKGEPALEAVAFQGKGVFETLKEVARQVLVELKKG